MRAERLVHTIDHRWLMRQLNMMDRSIERKSRLLMDQKHAWLGVRRADSEGQELTAEGSRETGKENVQSKFLQAIETKRTLEVPTGTKRRFDAEIDSQFVESMDDMQCFPSKAEQSAQNKGDASTGRTD
jgi:hypothetical protein